MNRSLTSAPDPGPASADSSDDPSARPRSSLGNVFVVSAPSGAGKTSLVRGLVQRDALVSVSVSHTTRPPRQQERNGVDYHFIDAATFDRKLESGDFLEHAQVYGHRYGSAESTVNDQRRSGHDVVLEIDWQGARQVRQRIADCITVFVLPPSLEQLASRLKRRATDTPEVIAKRLGEAQLDISHYGEFDYLLVNDDFETTLEQLCSLVRVARLSRRRQTSVHAELLRRLLNHPADASILLD